MPPDCEDNDQTQTPERTPAYRDGFGPNTDKLSHLLRLLQKAAENNTDEVKTLSAGVVGLSGTGGAQADKIRNAVKKVAKQFTDYTGGVLIVHEMMPVLFVAIVEAYLKDVIIFATGLDTTIMKGTGQTKTYQDAVNAKSLEGLILEFRTEWARSFVTGGPARWTKKLKKMGARGYRPDAVSQMETLWGVRHLIVHSAAVVNAEFVRRHPELKAEVGKRLSVDNAQIKQWAAAMYDFVDITDRYFVRRCQKSQTLLPSADAPKAPETQGESLINR